MEQYEIYDLNFNIIKTIQEKNLVNLQIKNGSKQENNLMFTQTLFNQDDLFEYITASEKGLEIKNEKKDLLCLIPYPEDMKKMHAVSILITNKKKYLCIHFSRNQNNSEYVYEEIFEILNFTPDTYLKKY